MAEVAAPARAEMVRPVGLPVMLRAVLGVRAVSSAGAVQAGVPRFRPMVVLAAAARAVLAARAVMQRAVTPAV